MFLASWLQKVTFNVSLWSTICLNMHVNWHSTSINDDPTPNGATLQFSVLIRKPSRTRASLRSLPTPTILCFYDSKLSSKGGTPELPGTCNVPRAGYGHHGTLWCHPPAHGNGVNGVSLCWGGGTCRAIRHERIHNSPSQGWWRKPAVYQVILALYHTSLC